MSGVQFNTVITGLARSPCALSILPCDIRQFTDIQWPARPTPYRSDTDRGAYGLWSANKGATLSGPVWLSWGCTLAPC